MPVNNNGIFTVNLNKELWEVCYTRSPNTDKVYLDYYYSEKDISFLSFVYQADMDLAEVKNFAIYQVEHR